MKNTSILKWFSVMLLVLIVAAAIGCGKGEEQQATPTPVPTATSSPTATAPAGQSGTLSDIAGEVQVLRSGTSAWSAATDGMKIWTGDGLKTGSDGYVLITFFDGSVMEVEAGTEISVDELSQAAGGATTVRIQQTIGNTINRVQNLVDSSSTYEVETPAGSAVVRGTVYKVRVNDYNGLSQICIDNIDQGDEQSEHLVDLSGGGETVGVPEGRTDCCWEGGQPGNPFYTNPGDDPLNADTSGGGPVCTQECWIGEGDFQVCICECCCPSSCSLFEDGILNGYGDGLYGGQIEGICVCPCGQGLCVHGIETCCHDEGGYYCSIYPCPSREACGEGYCYYPQQCCPGYTCSIGCSE